MGGISLDLQESSADLGFVFWPLWSDLLPSMTLTSTCPFKSSSAVSAQWPKKCILNPGPRVTVMAMRVNWRNCPRFQS